MAKAEEIEMTETTDPKTLAIMERMGYDDMIDAAQPREGVEIGFVGPASYFKEFTVVVHEGCDPENPNVGVSSVMGFSSLEDARRHYDDCLTEYGSAPTHGR